MQVRSNNPPHRAEKLEGCWIRTLQTGHAILPFPPRIDQGGASRYGDLLCPGGLSGGSGRRSGLAAKAIPRDRLRAK